MREYNEKMDSKAPGEVIYESGVKIPMAHWIIIAGGTGTVKCSHYIGGGNSKFGSQRCPRVLLLFDTRVDIGH